MRAVLQRVRSGQVSIDRAIVADIGIGYVILLGITHGDDQAAARKLAEKIVHLRIIEDDRGKMNRSALDAGAEMLIVSQFTLFADAKKGRRPGFTRAAAPEIAEPLVDYFVQYLTELGIKKTETGVFGARMLVRLENDGPVTIILDTDEL